MTALGPPLAAFWLCLLACGAAVAQDKPTIYACVDAKGRRLTSDRPIMECLDREQKQYGNGGLARGTLPPSMTGEERAAAERRARDEQEGQQRQAGAHRRDRLLLARYPDESSHQRERDASLARLDDVVAAGERRLQDLQRQRQDLQAQHEKAGHDVLKSQHLKRSLDEIGDNIAAQQRLLAAQRDERQRFAARFDEELERLKVLWSERGAPPAAAASRPHS